MILIREVADAPVITGISKPAGLKFPCGKVKIMSAHSALLQLLFKKSQYFFLSVMV
jgi:hypothetical protein